MQQYQTPHFLRRKQVEARTGLSRSSIYSLMAKGQFPRPAKLTAKAVGWPASAVDAWIAAKTGAL
jgi:prophage regulatory protein